MLRLHIIICGLIFSGLTDEITEYARYAYEGKENEYSHLHGHRDYDADEF